MRIEPDPEAALVLAAHRVSMNARLERISLRILLQEIRDLERHLDAQPSTDPHGISQGARRKVAADLRRLLDDHERRTGGVQA